MTRIFSLSRVHFLERSFLMESFIDPWGEDDPILGQIHSGTFDECQTLGLWGFLITSAPEGSIMLDVGSYAGLFSLVATSLRDDVKCVAFEASTVTFGRLASNITWNKRDLMIIPANLAVSLKAGHIRFPHAFGIYSMSPGEAVDSHQQIDHTQTATAIRLDSLLSGPDELPDYLNSKAVPFGPFHSIAAIKIDVEGHEISVLHGSLEILGRFRPVVICESLSDTAQEILVKFFSEIGYILYIIKNERNIAFIPSDKYESTIESYENFILRRQESLSIAAARVLTFIP